uniref:Uncharacterized protein n=1 Tax=Timema genevievae TaxID=629358 RepID=A0A7R9JW66_TIMGE|nr:unnamed protein product [Timema genevievae]
MSGCLYVTDSEWDSINKESGKYLWWDIALPLCTRRYKGTKTGIEHRFPRAPENHPKYTQLGSIHDLPVIGSLVYYESSALEHMATEASNSDNSILQEEKYNKPKYVAEGHQLGSHVVGFGQTDKRASERASDWMAKLNFSAVKVVVVVVLLGAILIPAWADEGPKPSKQILDVSSKPISSKSEIQQHSFGVTAFVGAGGPAVGAGAYYPGYGAGIGSGFGGYPGYNRGYYPSAIGAYPGIGGYQSIGGYPSVGGYPGIGGYPDLGGYSGLSNGGYYSGLGGGMGLPFNFYSAGKDAGKKGVEQKKPVEEVQKA